MHLAKRPAAEFVDELIRVVLVGNERVTRAGLRILIDSQPGFRVIDEVECTGNLDALWSASQPQVVLIDLDGNESIDFIPNPQEGGISSTRIIVLTSTPESAACSSAIERGVLGVVSKQQAPEILLKAIERVHAGEVWLNRARIAGVIGSLRPPSGGNPSKVAKTPETLTPRERQIVTLVGRGLRNLEIAEAILVSEATVRNGLGSIFRKLGISNRVNLMIYAIREGFVNQPVSENPSTVSARRALRLASSKDPAARRLGNVPDSHIK
jgi:two-component system, NarL family, nitrate/nitrite response regulator NarL